jgi:hypothetical protein
VFLNESGDNIINYTFSDYGTSSLCSIDFNITQTGSYAFTVTNGDTGSIIVRYENMLVGITIAIGIVIALFMFLAFKLDNTHFVLRLLMIFFSVALISLLPAIYIIQDFNIIFNKIIMGFVSLFWIYVGGYIFYYVYTKIIGIIVKR